METILYFIFAFCSDGFSFGNFRAMWYEIENTGAAEPRVLNSEFKIHAHVQYRRRNSHM